MQDRHPPRVVRRARRLLARLDEVLAGQRLEADEDPRAAGQRHLADQRRVVGHVDRDGGAPDDLERPQGAAELPQVLRPRAEVVVDEDAVGLPVGAELGDHLLDVPDLVGHRQPLRRQVAEAATVVAAPRGDQAGRRQEAPPRQQVAARRRIVAIGTPIAPAIDRPERPRLDVAEDLRPDLDALADRQRVGVRRGLLRAGQHMQPAEDDLRPALAVPARQLVGPLGERQVDRDPDDLRERLPRRRTLQQVLVPVSDLPVRRRRPGDARQRQRRRQHVLAEAGVRVLGIERIDQQGIPRPGRTGPQPRVESGATLSARGIHRDFMGESSRSCRTRLPRRRDEGGFVMQSNDSFATQSRFVKADPGKMPGSVERPRPAGPVIASHPGRDYPDVASAGR